MDRTVRRVLSVSLRTTVFYFPGHPVTGCYREDKTPRTAVGFSTPFLGVETSWSKAGRK